MSAAKKIDELIAAKNHNAIRSAIPQFRLDYGLDYEKFKAPRTLEGGINMLKKIRDAIVEKQYYITADILIYSGESEARAELSNSLESIKGQPINLETIKAIGPAPDIKATNLYSVLFPALRAGVKLVLYRIEPVVISFKASGNMDKVRKIANEKIAREVYERALAIDKSQAQIDNYVSSLKPDNIQITDTRPENVLDIKMREHVVDYSWSEHIDSSEQACALSYFINRFASQKKFRNPHKKDEGMTLERLMEVARCEDKDEGLSIRQVARICDYYRLPMIAFDIDGSVLEQVEPDVRNRTITQSAVVAFVLSDNHFYHIKPRYIREIKKGLTITEEVKKTRTIGENQKVDFSEFNPIVKKKENSKAIYKTREELNQIFEDKYQSIQFIGYSSGIQYLYMKDAIYGLIYNNEETHKLLLEDYEATNALLPHAPSPVDLGRKLMPDLSALQNKFISFQAPLCQSETYIKEDEYEDLAQKYTKSVDIVRCYKNALKNDFIQLSVSQEPVKYTNQLEPGYYYGRYKNDILDLGYRWYPYIQGDMPLTDIQYVLPALKVIKNPFSDFIKQTDKLNLSKNIVNHSIGTLNKTTMSKSKVYRTTSFSQAINLYEKGYQLHSVNGVYYTVETIKKDLLQNSKHIHDQILWRAFDNIMKSAQQFEKVFSIRTDSVWGILPANYEINKSLYRYEEKPHKWAPQIFNEKPQTDMSYYTYTQTQERKTITKTNIESTEISNNSEMRKYLDNNHSFYVNARAGYGKTHLLNRIKEAYNDKKILSLSMYNVASHNLTNGQTLENMLSRTKNFHRYYAILIDECGVMSDSDFAYIYKIHKLYPEIRFMLFGDFQQLKPINQLEPVYNSRAFNELIQGNELVLQVNLRNDLDYNKQYYQNDFKKAHILTKKNICYFNRTRIAINEKCMEAFSPANATKHDIKDGEHETYIKIYDDLPLRFTKNIPSEGIYNGNIRLYKDVKDKFKDIGALLKVVVPGYALTLYAVQGSTIDEEYTIHDANYIFADYSMKYVAYSRTTKKDNVLIAM